MNTGEELGKLLRREPHYPGVVIVLEIKPLGIDVSIMNIVRTPILM